MPQKYYKSVIFSKTPLKGAFRYKNEFQIYPAHGDDLPRNKHSTHFPIFIEFRVNESEKFISNEAIDISDFLKDLMSQGNKLKKLCNLLSAFTNHRFFTYDNTEGQWALNVPNQDSLESMDESKSEWVLGYYRYPNYRKDMQINKLSELSFPIIEPIEHGKYYIDNPDESSEKDIKFPQTLLYTFDAYFDLKKESKNIVDSAAYLICNGIDIMDKMKSLSFLSYISSIETIINFEYSDKNSKIKYECEECKRLTSSPFTCKKCNNPIWGVSTKFREFLLEYVHKSEGLRKKYNNIYTLRSKIIHNGILLLNDNQINWGNQHQRTKEWKLHRETRQLSRLALVNWIIRKRLSKNTN